MQPTPGQWMVDPFRDASSDDGEMGYIPIVNGTMTIAEVWLVNSDEEETRANAHLIAAAPDLLAALEQASREYMMLYAEAMADTPDRLRIVDMVKPATDAMTAAIVKAKGAL